MIEAPLATWLAPMRIMRSAAIKRGISTLGAKDREKEERERLEDWQRNFQERLMVQRVESCALGGCMEVTSDGLFLLFLSSRTLLALLVIVFDQTKKAVQNLEAELAEGPCHALLLLCVDWHVRKGRGVTLLMLPSPM